MFDNTRADLREYKMIIYQILNTKNGKSYIGQSTRSFCRRYSDGNSWWKPLGGKHTHLSRAVEKYGIENFVVRILEKNVKSVDDLNELEIFYIKKFNSISPNGYNYHSGGTNNNEWNRSVDSRDRMALKHSGGKIRKLLNNRTGVIHEFININRFAEEHDLSPIILCPLLNGVRYKRHKEWSLPENPIKKVILISPHNVEHVVLCGEFNAFCRKHKLNNSTGLFLALAGKCKSFYGWTVARVENCS